MGPWRTIFIALKADASGVVTGTVTGSTAVKRFGADSERVLKSHQEAVTRTGTRWQTVAKGIAGGLAVIGIALGLSLREAVSWESAFAGVAKTVDGTTAQLDQLENGLLSLARRLPATREEIAGVAEAAGALGIQRGAILSFTETMIGLGEATNLTADEAATMLAQFANIMGTSQTQFDSLADTLVNLGNHGASTEKEILELALRLAGAGATVGLTEKQVFALANAMASMGIDAELGGGALSRVMRKIEIAVADGGDKLDGFAKASHMSSAEFAKAWETDPAEALQTFLVSMKDVQDAGGNMYGVLADLGIKGSQDVDVIGRLINGADGLAQSFKDADHSSGALATEVEKRYATAESQLKVFRNQVTDIARIVGAKLIPVMLGALDAAESLGAWLLKVGTQAAERLQGAWDDLRGAGENLVELLHSLVDGGRTVATVLGQLVGAVAITSLRGFAAALEATTGFLADHSYAVYAAVGAYTALKVASGTGAVLGVLRTGWDVVTSSVHGAMAAVTMFRKEVEFIAVTQNLTKPAAAVQALTTSIADMATQSVSAGAIAGGAFAGIAVGASLATMALNKWHREGKQAAEDWLKGFEFDGSTLDSSMDGLVRINGEISRLQDKLDARKSGRTGLGALLGSDVGDAEAERLAARIEALKSEYDDMRPAVDNAIKGILGFREETGLTITEVENLADRAGIDIVDAFGKNGRASKELRAEYERTSGVAEAWGISTAEAADLSTEKLQLVEEAVKRIADAGDQTMNAWSSWSSILQVTDDPVDPKAVERSKKMVDDAKERVTQAQKEASAGGQTAEEAQRSADALADARDALDEATQSHADLLATDSPLNATKVKQFYDDRLAEAKTFTENMNKAIAAGYDPNLLSRLMQAGPEAAGPVLAALVEDTSASYVESINAAEAELSKFTAFAVRQAQLTQRAIELGTREAAQDLATAMSIEQLSMQDPYLTGNEIARRLGISLEDAQRVIDEYGLEVTVVTKTDTGRAEGELNEFISHERTGTIGYYADTDELERKLEEATRARTAWITIRTKLEGLASLGSSAPPGAVNAERYNRWGGVTHYATGGIHRYAMVGNGRGRVHWDEPATGGEAYVPRLGSKWRSIAVLGEAASWYGMELVPKQANQQPPPPRPVPFGGRMVPVASPQAPGRSAPVVEHLHLHGIEPDPRKAMREAEVALGTYG